MADFYFACRVHVDINRYPSADALLDRWLEEAEAAEGAEEAGLIQTVWKDVNEAGGVSRCYALRPPTPLRRTPVCWRHSRGSRWVRTTRSYSTA